MVMIPLNITDSLVDGYHSFEGHYFSDICMSDYFAISSNPQGNDSLSLKVI